LLGPAAPELGWVPAPRYLLRRDRVRRMLKNVPTGRLLEIGPGAGALLVESANMGFKCEALESSPEAQKLTKEFVRQFNLSIPMNESVDTDWSGKFDVVCAFDVLEHIENDRETLEQWCSWLKPGGTLLLSVPAHMKLWNSRDVWAGHYRRYERDGLVSLLEKTNFSIESFECYGFPLANLTEVVGNPIYRLNVAARDKSGIKGRQRGTELSGIDRSADLKFYPFLKSITGKITIWIFIQVQRLFLSADWGNGYVVKAVKR
jgi:SAM-dependent methyltransferase